MVSKSPKVGFVYSYTWVVTPITNHSSKLLATNQRTELPHRSAFRRNCLLCRLASPKPKKPRVLVLLSELPLEAENFPLGKMEKQGPKPPILGFHVSVRVSNLWMCNLPVEFKPRWKKSNFLWFPKPLVWICFGKDAWKKFQTYSPRWWLASSWLTMVESVKVT